MRTKMTGVVSPGNDRRHSNPQTHASYFFVRKAERRQKPFTRPASLSFFDSSTCRFLLLLGLFVALAITSGCAGLVSGANNTPSPTALSITNVQAASTTTSNTQIVWTTNVPADSAVDYGTTTSYGSSTPVDPTMVTNHQVTLSGLVASTTYYYQVRSTDSKNNHGTSGGHKFTTGGFSISGAITPTQGRSGATVTLSGASSATTIANGSGAYTFTGLPIGSYTITPSNAGYTFTPANQNVTVSTSNVTGVNFTANGTATAPTITTQPASQTVTAGQTATFSVAATGTAPLSYQWSKNGAAISGATSSSYTTAATTTADNGSTFRVVVTDSAGTATSNAATLTVNAAATAPTITTQPANQTVTAGQTATFTVVASGTAPLNYQWQKNGANIAGATSSSYTTPATTSSDNGAQFTVVVSNSAGSITSNAATLTVTSPPPPTGLFGHIAVVVEENTNYSNVTSSSMPYLSGLMTQYGLATQYYADTHPSIGNYLMLTTGQILTNNDSETPSSFPVSSDNVVRELVTAGKSWKAYAESLPSVGYLGGDATSGGGQYYVRHVPVAYFTDVQDSSTQQQNLVPFTQLAQDLSTGNLPNYSFITPNGCDDAHDCGLSTADNWLKNNIDPLIKNSVFQKDGLLIVVFDESSNDNTDGGGRVVCTLISPAFSKLGYQSTAIYQHESLLRLTLEGLGVTVLPGAASSAPAMWEFFGTSGGGSTPLGIATTSLQNGTVGQAYSAQLNATGGTSPYTWSISSGSLPPGLSLSPAGVISGTPTTAGSSTFTIVASDASSQTGTRNFTLTVASLTANAYTVYGSPSGSDSNPGTLSAPWRTPQKAANGDGGLHDRNDTVPGYADWE
jgi:phosphoesterase family protein/putative Ig domain-containing protein/carboxypeptidase family protein/Ig-like domain-containing protein